MAGTLPRTRTRDCSKMVPAMRAGTSVFCALVSGPQEIMLSKAESASRRESRFIMTSKPLQSHKGRAVVRVCSAHEGCQRDCVTCLCKSERSLGRRNFIAAALLLYALKL